MKLKTFLFLLVACFFFQTILQGNAVFDRHVSPEYVLIADTIIKEMAQKLSKRYEMKVIGEKTGMAKCINLVGLRFQKLGPLSKEKLREILVDCVEEFLQALNSNEKLRPHLKMYPFTSEGLDIAIFLVDASGEEIYDPDIGVASAYEGIISYKTTDRNNIYGYKNRIEENYDTALNIVKGEKRSNTNLTSKDSSKPWDLGSS